MAGSDLENQGSLHAFSGTADVCQCGRRNRFYGGNGSVGSYYGSSVAVIFYFSEVYY